MKKPLHPLLQYQLGKYLDDELLKNSSVRNFISSINDTYTQHQHDSATENIAKPAMETEFDRLALVAGLNKNGVVFTDTAGKINWHNEAFMKMTGYSPEEILGKTPIELLKGPETNKHTLREMLTLFYGGKPFEPELLCYRKNGSTFWGRCSGQVVRNGEGVVIEFFAIVEDVTTQKLAGEKLKRQEEKYRNILANMNLGLIEVDLEEQIQYVNNSFCKMSGYSSEELIGQSTLMLFAHKKDYEFMEAKNSLREKGLSDAYQITVKDKKGSIKYWLVSASPRYNDLGELVGSTGVHLDITDQKYMEDALTSSWEHAEESSRAKENFLANMSHEMRTPMNAIMGMAGQLEKTALRDEQRFYLTNIITAAENLLVIMNDILDISKIEAGQLVIENLPFRLNDVIEQVLRMHELKAEEKKLSLTKKLDPNIHPELIGDPFRLQQILVNLVGNAVKFTSEGYVSIECTVTGEKPAEQEITIKVTDTGSGIDPNYLNRIFEKFSQEDRSIARKFGGTGLGMSIVKNLTELLGGSISIESTLHVGTTIVIKIPFEKSEGNTIELTEVLVNTDLLPGKKILLVEDNEMNTLVAKMLLQQYGIEVTEAANGLEAIEILKKSSFDLILMDIQMPKMDGLEATRVIRKELLLKTPIIALTAHAIKGEAEKCTAAGMNDFISKPYREAALVEILCKWLKLVPFAKKSTAPAPSFPGLSIDLSTLEAYSAGDPDFLQSLISVFCRQTPIAMIDMQRYFDERNFEQMAAVAHRIKPSIEMVGAMEATQILITIEHWDKQKGNDQQLKELLRQLTDMVHLILKQLQELQTPEQHI